MQNVETTENNDATKEIKTVEIDQNTQTSAMTGPTLIENPQVPTSQLGLDVSCSDDDEVSEVLVFLWFIKGRSVEEWIMVFRSSHLNNETCHVTWK